MNITKAWAAQLDDYVIDLAWSPDGRLLAFASAAGPITLFDAHGTRLCELPGHEDGTNTIAWAPTFQKSQVGGQRSEVGERASEVESQKSEAGGRRSQVAGQRSEVGSQGSEVEGQWSKVGATPVLASAVCPLSSDVCPPTSDIRPLASDGRPPTSGLLASGGQDGKVRLWDASGGRQLSETQSVPSAWVERVQWKPRRANTKPRIPNSKPQVPTPIFQAANPDVLAAVAGRKLLFLNRDGAIIHTFPDAPKSLSALAWHPRGGAIGAACFGGVTLWDADDLRVQRQLPYSGAIQTLVWSPDGRWLVAGAQDKAVHLWIPDEDLEFHMSGYETKVGELSFSADSRWLATGGSQDACVWDCSGAGPDGREPIPLPHSGRVCAVSFQHARRLLATAANDGELALWDITCGDPRVATVKLTAPVSIFAWSPDDTLLAVGSQKGGVLVLRVDA